MEYSIALMSRITSISQGRLDERERSDSKLREKGDDPARFPRDCRPRTQSE